MSRLPRPTWPKEEWLLLLEPNRPDEANAIQRFEGEITAVLRTQMREFINDLCQERGVGSPDLRRLVPVALWRALERVADDLLVEAAVVCREKGLPWAAMSMITDYTSPTNFQQRYGTRVDAALELASGRGEIIADETLTREVQGG
jgi:hypothetical protein